MKVFKNLSPQEEEVMRTEARDMCLADLHYLAKHVLGYQRVTDHYHREMARDIDTPRYKFKLLLHPRGHYKSTLGTEAFGIQLALRNPNARILITNVKLDNSRKFLRTIAQHFMSNPKLRWIWREWWVKSYASEFDRAQAGDQLDWIVRNVQDELTLLRPYAGREATFTTGAVDASMVSQHYNHITCDDLINREYVRTHEMVEKSILYFKDLLDLLDPDGTMLIIGTRWSHLDLYTWLIEEFGRKATFVVPERLAQGSLQDVITQSRESTRDKDWLISIRPTSADNPVFPEEFGSKVLQGLLEAKGPYEFGAQYQLDPTPMENQKFREEWFQPLDNIQDNNWLKTLDVCITVDPAISLDDQACNSAMVVCGYDAQNRMYLLDGVNEKLTEDELIRALFDLVTIWTERSRFVLPVGFEAIGFQALYTYNIEREMLESNILFGIEPITRRSVSKDERILRLVPRIKNGFYMPRTLEKQPYSATGKPYDLVQRLRWELLKFPFAGKKDLADALADQLDIVRAHRLPAKDAPIPEKPKREFIHKSIIEDSHRRARQALSTNSGVVRSM